MKLSTSAACGVYADIIQMVEHLAGNIAAVQQESRRAGQEAEKAQDALQQAEHARIDAAEKRFDLSEEVGPAQPMKSASSRKRPCTPP